MTEPSRALAIVLCSALCLSAACTGRTSIAASSAPAPSAEVIAAETPRHHRSPREQVGAGGESRASIGGVDLELRPRGETCVLAFARSGKEVEIPLALPPPCRFHLGQDGAVRTLRKGKEQRALIESSRPHPSSAGDCITKIRGIAVSGARVRSSPHTSTVASCPPFQWDEAMFIGLFE